MSSWLAFLSIKPRSRTFTCWWCWSLWDLCALPGLLLLLFIWKCIDLTFHPCLYQIKFRCVKFMKDLKNWGVSARARHFVSSSSRSSWLWGRRKLDICGGSHFSGEAHFSGEIGLIFVPTFWNFPLISICWLGQNGDWWILWKDNLRTKASLGISWAREPPQQQKKFCPNMI